MEITSSRLQKLEAEEIECWDDDEDLHCGEDIYFRTTSSAASVTGSSVRPSGHRDSISSRRSCRSDRDSNYGDEESWQLLLNENDEFGTEDAISSAKNAGIPIPDGIPKSALLGGTIKRLGGRKGKRVPGDDWSDDLDLAGLTGGLELRFKHEATSPESLLHLSSLPTSPSKSRDLDLFTEIINNRSPAPRALFGDLDKFRDTDEDASFDDVPTIKMSKPRLLPSNPFTTPPPKERTALDDSFENDLVLPSDDEPLRLSNRQDDSKASDTFGDEFDAEWAEGSIGVRFGGTKRETFSARSSTASALSPSVSSCLTAESEDGLDGLVLPDGPLDFEKSLQKRQELPPPDVPEFLPATDTPKELNRAGDDFFSGIEIGDGEVFDTEKLTLNRNIKRKVERPASPVRRGATTITFTSRTSNTRIPRLSSHERQHSTVLEPVSESGAPVSRYTRPTSRLSGHAAHSSLSNVSVSSTSSVSSNPSTRRPTSSRGSKETLRNDPTTTTAQLLKAKRSVPALRNFNTTISPSLQRSPGRPDNTLSTRATLSPRPKTPVDRPLSDIRLGPQRRSHIPFIPAGASPTQSHHVSLKTSRQFRRADSDSSGDIFMHQRSTSRVSNSSALSDTTRRGSNDLPPGSFIAAAKHTVTKPNRKRHFGDGTELDVFDDLPTSATTESKFVKVPIKKGPPRALRNRLSQSGFTIPSKPDVTSPSTPISTPMSPPRPDYTPRFARDTNASRKAREQTIASIANNQKERENGPLAPINVNWKTQPFGRPLPSPTLTKGRHGHRHRDSISKPHLIKPLGSGVHEAKSVKGMKYNPALYRWEGNENATAGFDMPPPMTPSKTSLALISNIGGVSGAQVVGSMVFDPQRMCWLKLTSPASGKAGGPPATVAHDEDDVFAGLEDLDDRPPKSSAASRTVSAGGDPGDDKSGDSSDEWPITEEFDVGPEFIRRQRAEEEKWRRKVNKWVSEDRKRLGDEWRWAIRDLVKTEVCLDTPMPDAC
ncbi:hypothetical protein LOZ66_000435 [Ophidiomyces ophidiicola]|nr:hypothetical protein LOZ66_000435 [Ophidiomyces ophidiicola]